MATGYTYPIFDGTEPSAAAFLRRYAYAFGALYTFRDSDRDKSVLPDLPEELALDAYEYRRFDESRERLKVEQAKTPQELHFEFTEYEAARERSSIERSEDKSAMRARYQSVLDALMAETPEPDSPAAGFLEASIKAVQESMDHDCYEVPPFVPNPGGFDEWNNDRLTSAERDVERTGGRLLEAQMHTRRNYEWLQDVKALIAKIEQGEQS